MIIHPDDNVEIREDGHKYALRDLKSGENVIKYGMPIGHATCDIAKGDHVHVHNVATNLGELLEYTYEPEFRPVEKVADSRTFMGYRRADGQVGIRNDIWVIPTVGCVNNLSRRLAATCGGIALEHPYGCSQLGDDHETTANLLAALAHHPNAGGVLIVALGCENNTLETFKERLGDVSKLNIRFLRAQDPGDEFELGKELIAELNKRPEISRAKTSFDSKYPMYLVEVDAAQCKRNGTSPGDVLDVLSGYVGGSYASNMNRFSKLYRVMLQAAPEYRLDTESLQNMFVRTSSGEMSPINQYLRLTRIYGPQSISRFNLFTAISVNGQAAEGYSSGQAIQAVREIADKVLPAGYGFEFGGMSREEASQGASVAIIFVICIVFIYLILCALYESLFIPVVIILSVPFGLAGSFLFARWFGLENNIYLQIGLLMLIGLLAKTAILLTEYASQKREEGMTITAAAMSAAKARLRPILMTSLTMIFGMLPLMFASGVGANGNISIGVGTVGGMLIGTIALLVIVPALFIVFQHVEEKVMPKRNREIE